MTKEQSHKLKLLKTLLEDLNYEKPNFKVTLDSIEAQVKWLKKSFKFDKVLRESAVMESSKIENGVKSNG